MKAVAEPDEVRFEHKCGVGICSWHHNFGFLSVYAASNVLGGLVEEAAARVADLRYPGFDFVVGSVKVDQ